MFANIKQPTFDLEDMRDDDKVRFYTGLHLYNQKVTRPHEISNCYDSFVKVKA